MADTPRYIIRIKGCLDPNWSDWFEGMEIVHIAEGETALVGPLLDQAALYGVLLKLRDLGLVLLAVEQAPPVGQTAQ